VSHRPAGVASESLIAAIRDGLRRAANPSRAAGAQAYMKSEMPFLGVPLPEVRRITREALAAHPPDDWRGTMLTLWRDASFREERYAALALARRHSHLVDLPLLEELVVSGAWWDYVDSVAPLVGDLLAREPGATAAAMRRWSRSPDRWKRRVSIICQLRFRDATDTRLLADCIEANLADPEFFVRKAIGWALREYSKTDPEWVVRFLDEHELSPLSRREALKWLATLQS
jgi:3-methyladenine DNA glycosylase AlkD